jgi:hypothetical protein
MMIGKKWRYNMTIKVLGKEKFILPLAMLSCGVLAILFGKELCWDLANYHYYNAYAFIHTRTSIDYWPNSFIHQYLNPTLDLITYFLINTVSPITVEFLLGAIHGINFWLVFVIARLFTTGSSKIIMAFIIALSSLYAPIALPSIGSFQNDNLVSILILASVFFQVKCLMTNFSLNSIHTKLILIAGMILGAATGLKLTSGIFIVGNLLALAILPIPLGLRFRVVMAFLLGTLIGICLTSGYWMYFMWQQHANPLFPFLNNIFHSPDFIANNWRDIRFLPHSLSQQLFFPFYFSWDGRTSDLYFRDFRFMVIYILFAAMGIKHLWNKYFNPLSKKLLLAECYIFSFFVFSYIVWQSYFSIARYLLTLELLSPLIIYLLFSYFIKNTRLLNRLTLISLGLISLLMQPVPSTRSTDYEGTFFNLHLPAAINKIPHAVVLISYPAYALNDYPKPQSYLIPYFPSDWEFLGVPFLNNDYLAEKTTINHIQSILSKTRHPIYLLTTKRNILKLNVVASSFALTANGPCFNIGSDRQKMAHQMVVLCPVKMSVQSQ